MRILRDSCIACVRLYRLIVAPVFMSLGVQCRFTPTCSEFSIGAFEKHGVCRGALLTIHRILCCHPLGRGGEDPVPDSFRFWRRNG